MSSIGERLGVPKSSAARIGTFPDVALPPGWDDNADKERR
jgi:hypothetical protein